MKTIIQIVLAMVLITSITGCASTKAYLIDRGRDARDMVTVAVEPTIVNASVQLGPLMTGLGLAGGTGFGLRSGGMGVYDTEELNLFYGGHKEFRPGKSGWDRGKGYDFWYGSGRRLKAPEGGWFTWLQCEVMLGLGVGVRVGANLAEILDFVLGWTTLDICGDDIEMQKLKQKSNKVPEDRPEC